MKLFVFFQNKTMLNQDVKVAWFFAVSCQIRMDIIHKLLTKAEALVDKIIQ